jgi:hypothetical protein
MAQGLSAHETLARSDTTTALQMLQELTPNPPNHTYLLYPYESLGFERLVQARLLFAQGMFEDVLKVASLFDTPGAASVTFPIFLPASLQLRLEAAERLGDWATVEEMRERLVALGSEYVVDDAVSY